MSTHYLFLLRFCSRTSQAVLSAIIACSARPPIASLSRAAQVAVIIFNAAGVALPTSRAILIAAGTTISRAPPPSYDADGPPQARYAANYFGKDYVVTSGIVDDYVALATRLLNDKARYNEWSARSLQRYEMMSDVKGYVKRWENSILADASVGF